MLKQPASEDKMQQSVKAQLIELINDDANWIGNVEYDREDGSSTSRLIIEFGQLVNILPFPTKIKIKGK